jgi:hypothetical protein
LDEKEFKTCVRPLEHIAKIMQKAPVEVRNDPFELGNSDFNEQQ